MPDLRAGRDFRATGETILDVCARPYRGLAGPEQRESQLDTEQTTRCRFDLAASNPESSKRDRGSKKVEYYREWITEKRVYFSIQQRR